MKRRYVKQVIFCLGTILWISTANAGSFLINEIAGFSDSTAVSPVAGNTGTTIGEQRSQIFLEAASILTGILQPSVDITIDAEFSSLFCDATSATLGSAGTTSVYTITGVGYADTWYNQALAQHLTDSVIAESAVSANFNSGIEGDPQCLASYNWYYGFDHNTSASEVDLLQVILHEIFHGVGFQTYVNKTTGAKLEGGAQIPRDDIYMIFLRDDSANKNWPAMTDTERKNSAIDTDDLVWSGLDVSHMLPVLSSGLTNNYPQLYAPAALSLGSSVSHFDTDVTYISGSHELMEHDREDPFDYALAVALLRDLGWVGAIFDYDDDGTNDDIDNFPQTSVADTDTDDDGMANNWLAGSGCSGSSCNGITLDGDDDNDGVQDVVDSDSLDNAVTIEISLPLNEAYKGLFLQNAQNE